MTHKEAIWVLGQHNRYRKGLTDNMPIPTWVTQAIDYAIQFMQDHSGEANENYKPKSKRRTKK